ncbi:MAG TPA: hypothetical protein VN982_16770 [Candidatus Dormibacteraeota bacterium]|jgi:hypothetical protein|nr:hypothetical protein [Candidatus Dormibacteraeota bacterium]
MNTFINLVTLATATLLALLAAAGLDWLLLRAAFHVMRPAAAQQLNRGTGLVEGARKVARAFRADR